MVESRGVRVTHNSSLHNNHKMGGGARYPYPKAVWSPAGGWWVRPSNWASNTAFAAGGILAVTYAVWSISAAHEKRVVQPTRWIPSMLWAKEFEEDASSSGKH